MTSSLGNALVRASLTIACPNCLAAVGVHCPRVPCQARMTWAAAHVGKEMGRAAARVAEDRLAVAPAGKWSRVNAARARSPHPGALNGVEQRYLAHLEQLRLAGEVVHYQAKPGSLRLGRGCHYQPDFLVVLADKRLAYDEVKGEAGWKLDSESRTKWAAAGESHQYALFRAATLDGEGFKLEVYKPVGSGPLGVGRVGDGLLDPVQPSGRRP